MTIDAAAGGIDARADDRALAERWAAPALVFISIIPLIVAYYFIGQSIRLDEAQSLWQASRGIIDVLSIVAGDVHVPLYHVLLHVWLSLFGSSVPMARLLSLVFFIASIPALYLLGKRAYSARVGLLAALLFALSPFMNWYANEVRMYTLFVFLTIVNQYLFVRLFRDERPSESVWALYALSAVLGVFSHYFFFLNILAQGVFYFLNRTIFPPGALRRFATMIGLVAVAFAPWVWFVLFRGLIGFQEPLLAPPSTVDLFSAFSQFLFGFQNDSINTAFLSLWPFAVILGLIALGRNQRLSPQTKYFAATVLISVGAAFFASYLIAPVFVSRYLIFIIPSFYLISISLFSSYPRKFRFAAECLLAGLMLTTLGIQIVNPDAPVKERYADAIAHLTARATAQDVIIVSAPFTIYPVQYYYRGPAAISTLPQWEQYAYGPIPPFSADSLPQEVQNAAGDYQNVYLILSYDQGYEKQVKDYFDSHYDRIEAKEFSNDLNVYAYRLRYDTARSAIAAEP